MVSENTRLTTVFIAVAYQVHLLSCHVYARSFSSCQFPTSVCGIKRLDPADRNILLQFKASVTESETLGDWNINRTCANGWSGVCTDVNGRVTEIGLPALYVDGAIPSSFSNLSKLLYLDLSGNYFRSLPNSFGSFPILSYLDLSFAYYNESILPIITRIKSLRTLILHGGASTYIPHRLGLLTNLVYLDISFTNLLKIPPSFGSLKKLRYLNVRRNILKELPPFFGLLPSLKELNLGDNQLNESAIDVIINLKKLTSLDLGSNRLNFIPQKLSSLSSLSSLTLNNNRIKMKGGIPSSFSNLKDLTYLDLSGNGLCGPFPLKLANLSTLQYLDLNSNYFIGIVPTKIMSKFCDVGFHDNCLVAETKKGCQTRESHPNYFCENECDPVPNLDKDRVYHTLDISQSSVYSYGIPELAVDGSGGKGKFSSHSCMHTLNQTDPYIRIQFNPPTTIKTVQLYNRLDCCSDRLNGVQVYVSYESDTFKKTAACKDPKFKYGPSQKGYPVNVTCNRFGYFLWVVVPGARKILSLCEIVVT